MSKYLPPSQLLNNPEYIQIVLKPNGHGGNYVDHVTHHTRVPSTNPKLELEEGWESVLYFRYIGSHTDNESPKNRLGGYVYVLTNKQYPSMCKIGMTTNLPENRLKQINNAGVVIDWVLAFSYKCSRPYDFEQALHSKLSYCRHRNNREFFDLPNGEVIKIINELGPMFGSLN